jgi:predicted secreted hydrolase
MKRRPPVAVLLGLLLAACSGPILANPPLVPIAPPTATPGPSRAPDPIPISLPRDDAPHDRLTEWWYYTGHLADELGGRWGFEFVIFRAERGGFPVTWASHLAFTDETEGTFVYDQLTAIGSRAARSSGGVITLSIDEVRPPPTTTTPTAAPTSLPTTPWVMAQEQLVAGIRSGHLALELSIERPAGRPPVLHDGDGWIDFGAAGGSYYYSIPRLAVRGALIVDGARRSVEGTAWFDHQWGDFISVGGGGWDWFAVNLDDGTDLTISLVRAADGSYPLVYGTLGDADGGTTNLARTAFEVRADPSRTWTSPATGATYPAGWTIGVPGEGLVIDLEPTVAAQELDTRATTGVIYWEGSQVVAATRDGVPVGGQAYVELTGYVPAVP